MPAIGEMAPDFSLRNQDDEWVRLSDFLGQRVLLFAFPKANTSGCKKQACGFRDAFASLQLNNMVVLGISPDEPKVLKAWRDMEGLPYDLLSDREHVVLKSWGAWGERTLYGRTYMGVLRSHWLVDARGVVLDAQIAVSPLQSVRRALSAVAAAKAQ